MEGGPEEVSNDGGAGLHFVERMPVQSDDGVTLSRSRNSGRHRLHGGGERIRDNSHKEINMINKNISQIDP